MRIPSVLRILPAALTSVAQTSIPGCGATEVDRPEWSGSRPEVETSVTAMDTMVTWWQ